ncbi:unnamed protein product [Aphanomyces euteiches]
MDYRPREDVKILLDWFTTKCFKINRDIYNEECLGGTRSINDMVGLMFDVFKKHGPGVFIMQTKDVSKMGHFWTVHYELTAAVIESEDPPRGVAAKKDPYQQLNSIRKCVPRLSQVEETHTLEHQLRWNLPTGTYLTTQTC